MKLWYSLTILSVITYEAVSANKFLGLFGRGKSKIKAEDWGGQPTIEHQARPQRSSKLRSAEQPGKGLIQRTEPINYTPLQKERRRFPEGKVGYEAELAFVTMWLGFIEYAEKHRPLIVSLLNDYLQLKKDNKIITTSFSQRGSINGHLTGEERGCMQYLDEPVLAENDICYDVLANPLSAGFKSMGVHFDYYDYEAPITFVLKCPIKFRSTEKMFLYFSVSGRNPNWRNQQSDYYFVMTESPRASGQLSILMLTRHHPKTYGKHAAYRADTTQSKRFIRLTVPHEYLGDDYRFFGMDAERAFITVDYFMFLNYNRSAWPWIDQLIKYVHALRKGNETDNIEESKSKFKSLSEERKQNQCRLYINRSKHLRQKKIEYDLSAAVSAIKITKKKIKFVHIRLSTRHSSVMRCPVVLHNRQRRSTGYVYFKTVYYRTGRDTKWHTFILMPSTGDTTIYIDKLEQLDPNLDSPELGSNQEPTGPA